MGKLAARVISGWARLRIESLNILSLSGVEPSTPLSQRYLLIYLGG